MPVVSAPADSAAAKAVAPTAVEVESSRLLFKTRLIIAVVVLSNMFGNAALALGMKHHAAMTFSPFSVLRTIFDPWIGLGIVLLVVWLLSRMAMMSWADLSYVLPVTSVG